MRAVWLGCALLCFDGKPLPPAFGNTRSEPLAEDLRDLPKGSAKKIALATLVKQRTSVTNAWLSERLNMGAATRVSWNCGHTSGRRDVKKFIKLIEISTGKN